MAQLLERKDRMSMASGLEVRVPFCDHKLAEYIWNIPWELKTLNGREKGIMRFALKGLLPENILDREKSPYPKTHNPAYSTYVKRIMTDILNDSASPILSLINTDYITRILQTKSDSEHPFFGQLMNTPQMYAYLIQINFWMSKYKVTVR